MRPSACLRMWLLCSLAVLACGREPLDLGPRDSAGGTGTAGATGSAGTTGAAGTSGAAGMTGSAGAPSAPLPVPAVHRPAPVSCPRMTLPASAPTMCLFAKAPGVEVPAGWCNSNADCTSGTDGRCVPSILTAQCSCEYDACFADADCPGGDVCACSGVFSGNACVSGSCRVDADCGAGGFCSPTVDHCSGVITGYFCRTAKDTCTDDKDCGDLYAEHCARDPGTGVWGCQSSDGCPM